MKPAYNSVYVCREQGHGGGVAIIIKVGLEFTTIAPPEYPVGIEIIGAEIKLLNSKIHIYSYYNSPTTLLSNSTLEHIYKKSKNVIICGDLNSKHTQIKCRSTNESGKVLVNFLESSSSAILNGHLEPTYIQMSKNYSERLDVVIASPSISSKLINVQLLLEPLLHSDHLPIITELGVYKSVASNTNNITTVKTQYNKADWNKFGKALDESCATIPSEVNNDPNRLNDSLIKALVTASSTAIPSKRSSSNNKEFPKSIVDKIKAKKIAMRAWYKVRSEENLRKFETLTKQVKQLIRRFRDDDYNKFMKMHGPNPTSSKPFWRRINQFRSKPVTNNIATIVENGVSYTSDQQKADIFATHLASIFSDSNEPHFKHLFKQDVEEEVANFNFLDYDYKQHLITTSEINSVISQLNNKTTLDPHGVSNRLLKKSSPDFRAHLVALFNSCLREGVLPTAWKESNVHMLKKKADSHSTVKNYRPISHTSCICKLFERVIQTRLVSILNEKNIITNIQSGFRKHRSTKDSIFCIIQKALETFNRNHNKRGAKWKMIALPFDVQSAFDKVWHNGMEYKLIKLKIPTYIINWIKQFLSDRVFRVIVNGVASDPRPIQCGVPQGAVLSPLLFSIFINDIPDNTVTNFTYSFIFADDLIFLHIYLDNAKATKVVNDHLTQVEEWLDKWRLKMAVQKCSQIIFHNQKSSPKDLEIKLYGTKIQREKEITFLGIVLDEKLNLNSHIDSVKKKVISRLNIIKTVSHRSWKLSKSTLINLYTSLIRSVFEYSAILAPRLSTTLLSKLQVIQNNALRSILHIHFNKETGKNTSIDELHRLATIPRVSERLTTLRTNYLVNAVETNNPIILRSILEYNAYAGGRNLSTPTLLDEFVRSQ
jgi:hypothetical protein